jgi:cellulose synthase operon protein C
VLRSVLARRLMRAGRHGDAIRYFDDEHVRSVAEEYLTALGRANSWWRSRVVRAEAWYSAATIARYDGMEILGFEMSPDYAVLGGGFSLDREEDVEAETTDPKDEQPAEPNTRQGAALVQDPALPPLLEPTATELQRVKASAPNPNTRFQYRVTAVDHAAKAADLLPASSQAFAAVLCKATGWILNREPDRAEAIYARYVREGAYMRWARSFGRSCPQPDFASANRRVWALRFQAPVVFGRSHPWLALPAFLALLAATVLTGHVVFRRHAAARDVVTAAAAWPDAVPSAEEGSASAAERQPVSRS